MAKVILLSQFPLPYSHIGSWTTMYRNYLQGKNSIDILVCEKPAYRLEHVDYHIVEGNIWNTIKQKATKNKHHLFVDAVDKLIVPGEKYVLQVVDNFGLAKSLQKYIEQKNLRQNCYLQFFFHGHEPTGSGYNARFYEKTDEIVVLTHSAYRAFKAGSNVMPSRFSVLNNGIDPQKFHTITANERNNLKQKHGFADKKVLLWCAQDRPKKGLHIVLDAWKKIYANHKDAALVVIGTEAKPPQAGVFYFGRIQNDLLPEYYQMADVYLFPTLCQEGFGMSLIEALHCGCYCIASALGGVPEVLQHGKFGKLIENPHFSAEWVEAIQAYLAGQAQPYDFPDAWYTSQKWNRDMDAIIAAAKQSLE